MRCELRFCVYIPYYPGPETCAATFSIKYTKIIAQY